MKIQVWLERTNTDGVCITSLTVDGKQLLVGKNSDMQSFWIDGDHNNCLDDFTGTTQMTIKNGLGKFLNFSHFRSRAPSVSINLKHKKLFRLIVKIKSRKPLNMVSHRNTPTLQNLEGISIEIVVEK